MSCYVMWVEQFEHWGFPSVNRAALSHLAKQTVEIVNCGVYTSAGGRRVEIGPSVRECVDRTRSFTVDELRSLRDEVLERPAEVFETAFEVVNETTLGGIERVSADGRASVAALNFASARNPGGGFLNGSQAQEESLARSSALYASLCTAADFYERHRASPSLLYSDALILSPGCPIFRDDHGTLLEEPRAAAFLTCAAPNAGALATKGSDELGNVSEVLLRRSECVLAVAAAHGYTRLVLGAWGCGVFRNDPVVVSTAFAQHLRHGAWAGRFERVVFSVWDPSAAGETVGAFHAAFGREKGGEPPHSKARAQMTTGQRARMHRATRAWYDRGERTFCPRRAEVEA